MTAPDSPPAFAARPPAPADAAARALVSEIEACRICAGRFAATATHHEPRPVVWFGPRARILIAGQAPGMKVHQTGVPFNDPSGVRLRAWLGLTDAEFYDHDRVAIVPMAFCFPGYDAKGSDLPPPPVCALTWHRRVMAALPDLRLVLVIGGAAQRWHLNSKRGVSDTVAAWQEVHARPGQPRYLPLPHPSWRNTAWLKRHPWFEADLLPVLRAEVRQLMDTP